MEPVRTEAVMHLIRAREDAFGQLAAAETARNQFQRDIIPATPGGGPGVASTPAPPPVRSRADLIADTNVVAGVLASNFPWMYAKPKDEKGETKQKETVIEKAEDQIEGIEDQTKEVKKGNSFLGKIIKYVIGIIGIWTLFGDKIKGMFGGLGGGIWDNIKWLGGWIWEKLKWLGGKLWDGLKWLWEEHLKPWLQPAIDWIGDKIKKGWALIGGAVKNIWDNTKLAFGKFIEFLGQKLDRLINYIKQLPSVLFTVLVEKGSREFVEKTVQLVGAPLRIGAAAVDAVAGTEIGKGMDEWSQKIGGDSHEMFERHMDKAMAKEEAKGPGRLESGARELTAFLNINTDADFKSVIPDTPEGKKLQEYVDAAKKKGSQVVEKVGSYVPEPVKDAVEHQAGVMMKTLSDLRNVQNWENVRDITKTDTIKREFSREQMKENFREVRDVATAAVSKPLNTYLPTMAKDGGETAKRLDDSNALLNKIEQNTRGGGGVAVVPGQRGGASTGSKKAAPAQPNITMGAGAKKLDARGGYVPSAYAILPNTLTE